MLIVAEILVVVTLQARCPSDGLVLLLAQLAAVGHGAVGVALVVEFAVPEVSGIERVLAPPALDVGILDVGRCHGVEEETLHRLVAQVERGRHGVGLLAHRRVVEFLQDAVAIPTRGRAGLQVFVVRAVVVVGGNGTAGVIGIVDGVVGILGVAALVDVAVEVELQLHLRREVHVDLRHGRIAAVGGRVDDVVLVGISQRGVVAHTLRAAGDAHRVVVREAVVGQYVKPVGVHRLHAAHLLLKLLLAVDAGVELLQGLLIAHLGHARGVDVVLVYEILRELYALAGVHQVDVLVGIVWSLAHGELS